ncbi:MAG: hypothetical protein R2705_25165 [Ilumatobacteraceae bacterium]
MILNWRAVCSNCRSLPEGQARSTASRPSTPRSR